MNRHPDLVSTNTAHDQDDHIDEFDDLLESQLSDPAFAAAYEDAAQRARLLADLVSCRKAQKIKQRQIASHMGVSQSVVSEFENAQGDVHYSTLQRYARAVGARLNCRIEMPAEQSWANHVGTTYSQRDSPVPPAKPVVRRPDTDYVGTWARQVSVPSAA